MRIFVAAEAVIGFRDTSYTVREGHDQVNVPIGVIQGSLQRPVVVNFTTVTDSALGD